MSIRRRLVLGLTVVAVLVFSLAGVLTVLVLEQRLIDAVDIEIAAPGGSQLRLGRSGFPGLGQGPGEGADRLFEKRDIAVFVVAGDESAAIPSGTSDDPDPLPDIDPLTLEPAPPFTANAVEGDLRYRVAVHDLPGGRLVLAASLEDTDDAVRSLARVVSLVSVAAVVVVGAAAWWIVRRGLSPIDGMIETAERVGDGTLSERIEIVQPDTEVGHLASAINGMLGRVEEAVEVREASERRVRRFASDASHELRTPLTSIRGYAELFRHGGDEAEQVERSFSRIESESARMGRMLEDLLLLTRLDQDQDLNLVELDLGALVSDAVEDARVVEPGRPIAFSPGKAPVLVNGDEDRLRQVLGNLLANVRDHTGPEDAVAVTLSRESSTAILSIADQGPGMDPGVIATARERFARGNTASGGSGLGLAIVDAIVHTHQGRIELDGEGGTTVTVRLPAADPDWTDGG